MDTAQDYFSLFDLTPGFDVDLERLSNRYRALQREVHPDRFAHAGEAEQLQAVQRTAHLNDALATLKSPLKRAVYLLHLQGVELGPESSRAMDPSFLMEQMELREGLEAVRAAVDPEDALASLERRVKADWDQLVREFKERLEQGALDGAADSVRKMQFLDKMHQEIERLEDQLMDD
ncbi:co-chaperone HscB [Motiliproteus sp. SC1-56]|uniref:co-chaperone HscB n=1 Tax=Motiliproteus sp. SC1-56 TaxID=2799565 RepID=UPI001A8D8FA7|nr:co-chaperone HscB [Motiliproteus sp. SC1-56]